MPGLGRISRRLLLVSGASACLASSPPKGPTFPSEWKRYADPATEFNVYRLTDPAYTSTLAARSNPTITRDSGFLLFSCDRTGSPQAFLMDLRKGDTRQLTDIPDLEPASLSLIRGDRSFCYAAGRALRVSDLITLRDRELCRLEDGCEPGGVGFDPRNGYMVERRGESSRLRAVPLEGGRPRTVLETPFPISDPMPRPDRPQILYRQGRDALWLTDAAGRNNRKLKLAPGAIGPAGWSAGGQTILYLSFPADPSKLNAIREYTPEAEIDKLVAPTSQFVSFGFNRDSSVFAGASRNAASPAILLLLRLTRREMIVCEHRSSRPEAVGPMFSPDSQRMYFQSDRHGKPAIYALRLDKLVEKTEGEIR